MLTTFRLEKDYFSLKDLIRIKIKALFIGKKKKIAFTYTEYINGAIAVCLSWEFIKLIQGLFKECIFIMRIPDICEIFMSINTLEVTSMRNYTYSSYSVRNSACFFRT